VQVIAAGVDDRDGVPWLVMELLAGEELGVRVKRAGPMTSAEVKVVCEQLGHALRAAHAAQIVHRDLKPSNLFLCPSRVAGLPFSVKVLDFGIAKMLAEAQTSSTQGMGTPLWMPPEQTEARAQVGPASDVWPLGLIVYFMLSGKMYWNSANSDTSGVHTVLREILMEPIVPPSQRAREQGGPPLPPGFDAWFLRCLERDFNRRPSNVGALVDELGAILTSSTPRIDGTAYAPPPPTHAMGVTPAQPQPTGYAAPAFTAPGTATAYGAMGAAPSAATAYAPSPTAFSQTPSGHAFPPPPPPPAVRRKSTPLIAFIAGVLALAGIAGVVYYATTSSPSNSRSSRSRDDDDDDDTPRKKKTKPSDDDDGAADGTVATPTDECTTLTTAIVDSRKKFDAIAEGEGTDFDKLTQTADAFEEAARDARALNLTDPKLIGFRDRYASLVSNIGRSSRSALNAATRQDGATMSKHQKDIEEELKLETPLTSDINAYCGPGG
jgi:serine/threonine protein kinase